mmetsp:Transcript_6231/g.16933  ORF Transcript_6231/g.16933 Transcript_6231/m.16933 type:complete len:211 (-) Transcript_6231:618-1250(-)
MSACGDLDCLNSYTDIPSTMKKLGYEWIENRDPNALSVLASTLATLMPSSGDEWNVLATPEYCVANVMQCVHLCMYHIFARMTMGKCPRGMIKNGNQNCDECNGFNPCCMPPCRTQRYSIIVLGITEQSTFPILRLLGHISHITLHISQAPNQRRSLCSPLRACRILPWRVEFYEPNIAIKNGNVEILRGQFDGIHGKRCLCHLILAFAP